MRRLGVVVVALLVVVTGFAKAAGHHSADANSSPRPLEGAIYFSADELAILHSAEQSLVQQCMLSAGFPYEVLPPGDLVRVAAADPYQILDSHRAATDGYGLTATAIERLRHGDTPIDPNDRLIVKLPSAQKAMWRNAFYGNPKHRLTIKLTGGQSVTTSGDGCSFAARRQLYGAGWDRLFYQLQDATNSIVLRVTKDPAFLAAQRSWAECMTHAGFHAVVLDDPRRTIEDQIEKAHDALALNSIGREELAVASRDSTCQRSVRLARAARTAQAAAQAAFVEAHRIELAQFRQLRVAALQQAQTVTS